MSNQHTIFRVIIPGKIPVQRTQQIINAIVDICSGFTTGNTIIKNSVFPTVLCISCQNLRCTSDTPTPVPLNGVLRYTGIAVAESSKLTVRK